MAMRLIRKTTPHFINRALTRFRDRFAHDRTKDELLDSLKTSMEQVLSGDYRPALEVLDEIDREAAADAHVR